MMDQLNITILLLAAGSSSRMGQSKQLLDIRGESLLTHSAKIALSCSAQNNVMVVLGANAQAHRESLANLTVHIIVNDEWQKGMGSSLKKGIAHLKNINPTCDAVIVSVCDQPLVSVQHLEKLMREYKTSHQSIIASFYKDTPGVPVLFDRKHFDDILNLDDSEGAKKIIMNNKTSAKLIDFPQGAMDLDTLEDYRIFLSEFQKS